MKNKSKSTNSSKNILFIDVLERENMVKSSATARQHGAARYLFQIHSHVSGIPCLYCHQAEKESLPNGIICFITIGIDKISQPAMSYDKKRRFKFEIMSQEDQLNLPFYIKSMKDKDSIEFKPDSFMPQQPSQNQTSDQQSSLLPLEEFHHQPLTLRNRRNDCFGNAIVQTLLHLNAVQDLLKKPPKDDVVLMGLKKLSENARNLQSIAAFMNEIAKTNPLMNDMQQHDASLFLQLLIEMSPALKRLFAFESIIKDICSSCNTESKKRQLNHFGLLDFNQPTFKKMFFEHDQEIEIEKDCASPQCLKRSKNKKRGDSRKHSRIEEYQLDAEVLMLRANLFSYSGREPNFRIEKIKKVIIPDCSYNSYEHHIRYELKAVLTHEGTVDRGHYFTDLRSNSGKWINCNDDFIQHIEKPSDMGMIFIYEKSRFDLSNFVMITPDGPVHPSADVSLEELVNDVLTFY